MGGRLGSSSGSGWLLAAVLVVAGGAAMSEEGDWELLPPSIHKLFPSGSPSCVPGMLSASLASFSLYLPTSVTNCGRSERG